MSEQVWTAACTQIFFSLGVGYDGLMSFASYNPSDEDLVTDALEYDQMDAVRETYRKRFGVSATDLNALVEVSHRKGRRDYRHARGVWKAGHVLLPDLLLRQYHWTVRSEQQPGASAHELPRGTTRELTPRPIGSAEAQRMGWLPVRTIGALCRGRYVHGHDRCRGRAARICSRLHTECQSLVGQATHILNAWWLAQVRRRS